MFTVGKTDYTCDELLAELRRLADDDQTGVVWHDMYRPALAELDELGRQEPELRKFADINGVLMRVGSMLVGEEGYRRAYSYYVDQGARKILAGGPAFERSGSAKTFNAAYWLVVGAGDDAYLRLRQGVTASDAMDDLVEHSGAFTFDCSAFVQAVELYARAKARGSTRFNNDTSGRPFALKEHGSTGLSHQKVFFRSGLGAEWRLRTPATDAREGEEPTCRVTDSQLLRIAPVGCRVAFANADELANDTDYERENTVKLADGVFASQPFGVHPAERVRRKLAQQTILRYVGEIEENLKKVIAHEDSRISVEDAVKAQAEIEELEKSQDQDAQTTWILEHKDLTDKLIYDDLDEYIADLIYLAEVEIYTITPENDQTLAFGT